MIDKNKLTFLYYEELTSTNDKLLSIASQSTPFTVVYTQNQTKGKGYGGNKWSGKPWENLTFSFLLSFDLNELQNVLKINFWVITQLHAFIHSMIDKKNELKIKWPNDLILNKKKIAGILIENKILGNRINCVIGIGLNVNQQDFPELPNASSLLNETEKTYNLEKLLADVMNHFLDRFSLLTSTEEGLIDYFNHHLFMKNQVACFQKNEQIFNGIIQQVSVDGELYVQMENDSIEIFKHKEVILLF